MDWLVIADLDKFVTNAPCLPVYYSPYMPDRASLLQGSLASGILDSKVSFGRTYFLLLQQHRCCWDSGFTGSEAVSIAETLDGPIGYSHDSPAIHGAGNSKKTFNSDTAYPLLSLPSQKEPEITHKLYTLEPSNTRKRKGKAPRKKHPKMSTILPLTATGKRNKEINYREARLKFFIHNSFQKGNRAKTPPKRKEEMQE